MFRNKKASVADSVFVPIYILVIAMTMFVGYYVWSTFVTNFTPLATNVNISSTENLTRVMSDITVSMGYFDYMFPFLVFGLLLVSLIFAFKTGASIVYAFVSIFMWALAVIMSIVYAEIFRVFELQFTAIGGNFLIVSYIMANIKWISLIWAFLISVVMFTRNKSEEGAMMSSDQAFVR
jgi:hypothetical protein